MGIPPGNYEKKLRQVFSLGKSAGNIVLNRFTSALSSVITVSAPSLLLSWALLLLLTGMGVFLGFIWVRELDVDAGVNDSRAVFIVNIVVLAISFALVGFFSLGRIPTPAKTTFVDSLKRFEALGPPDFNDTDEDYFAIDPYEDGDPWAGEYRAKRPQRSDAKFLALHEKAKA